MKTPATKITDREPLTDRADSLAPFYLPLGNEVELFKTWTGGSRLGSMDVIRNLLPLNTPSALYEVIANLVMWTPLPTNIYFVGMRRANNY
jgi:hypothetical protein